MSAFANLDTGFPMFNSKMNTEQKLKAMEDYLVQVLEQLRYTLNNLGADNFNETDLKNIGVEINQPVYAKIEDVDSDLRTEITATAEGVAVDIRKDYATSWVTGTVYKVNDVIKRETTQSGVVTAVGFYKCKKEHTAADNNRPPTGAYWSDYWSVLQSADALQSRFVMNAEGVKSTVAQSTQQYAAPLGVSFSVYGYGAPSSGSAANHNNQYYLDQSSGKYYKSNGSTWTLQGTCNLTATELDSAISTVDQKADSIQLQVTGASAPEWVSGATYTKDYVVKVTTAATASTPQSITYYKAKSDHTAAAGNKPPNATYWTTTTAPNVNSMIDLNLNGLTLSYDNGNIGNNEHNGSYIKLMKDGTFIGGGKVFIKDLDASTIKTGTLEADDITMNGGFTVTAKSGSLTAICGELGGIYNGGNGGLVMNIPDYGHLYILPDEVDLVWHTGSKNGWFRFENDGGEWVCSVPTKNYKAIYFDGTNDRITVRCGSTEMYLETDTIRISRWKNGVNTVYDLFDKLGQIT